MKENVTANFKDNTSPLQNNHRKIKSASVHGASDFSAPYELECFFLI